MTRTLVAIAAVLMVLAPAAPAAADPGRDEIYAQLGVDEVPADYVVLVDVSASMATGGLYGDVRSTLTGFLAGLTPTDHLALFTFSDEVVPAYVGQGGNTDRIVGSLPGTAGSGGTDIGAAIDRAVAELERSDAAGVASVVLISDGGHYPAPNSAYPSSTGPAWDELAGRARRLSGTVHGYALPLRGATGAGLLRSVLPATETLDPASVPELAAYLDRSKERARLDKARLALRDDLGKGVRATWTAAAGGPIALTLTAETRAAPLTVTGLGLGPAARPGAPAVVGELPGTVALAPGESRTFPLTLRWRPSASVIPFHASRSATVTPVLTGQVGSPWAGALGPDVRLDTPAAVQGSPPTVAVRATVGTWLAQAAVAAVALLVILIVWFAAFLRRRAPQSGTLVVIAPETGEEVGRFPLRGRCTRVASERLPGRGRVTARRARVGGIEYTLRYQRADRVDTGTFPSRGTTLVGGLAFEHVEP